MSESHSSEQMLAQCSRQMALRCWRNVCRKTFVWNELPVVELMPIAVTASDPTSKNWFTPVYGCTVGVGWKCNLACFFLFFNFFYFLLHLYRVPRGTWLVSQWTPERVLVVSRFLACDFIPRVNRPPFIPQKPLSASAEQPGQGRLPAWRPNRRQTAAPNTPLVACQTAGHLQDGNHDV